MFSILFSYLVGGSVHGSTHSFLRQFLQWQIYWTSKLSVQQSVTIVTEMTVINLVTLLLILFNKPTPGAKGIKTFYGRNLRIFAIN